MNKNKFKSIVLNLVILVTMQINEISLYLVG